MTFERFYSIIRPHKAASFNTLKRAKITIAFTYVFSFSYNIPYLFIGDNNGRTCIPNRLAPVNVYGAFYYWLTEIISFILPFVSLLTMNSVIIHTLRQRSKLNLTGSEGQVQSLSQNSKCNILGSTLSFPENESYRTFHNNTSDPFGVILASSTKKPVVYDRPSLHQKLTPNYEEETRIEKKG